MSLTDYDREHVGDIIAGDGTWFTAGLLRLCAHADRWNLERIRQGFPDVVEAFESWQRGEVAS